MSDINQNLQKKDKNTKNNELNQELLPKEKKKSQNNSTQQFLQDIELQDSNKQVNFRMSQVDQQSNKQQHFIKKKNINKEDSLQNQSDFKKAINQYPDENHMHIEKIKYMKIQNLLDQINKNKTYIRVKKENLKLCNSHMYFFQIIMRKQKWVIRKTYQDFVTFDILVKKKNRTDYQKNYCLPELPYEKEPNDIQPQIIMDYLVTYLGEISKQDCIIKGDIYWDFLEISDFKHNGIVKIKETWISKRAGGRYEYQNCFRKLFSKFNNWNKRYMIITTEGVMYSKENRDPIKIREMLLFDQNFQMDTGKKYTGQHYGIQLKTSSRKLVIKANTFYQFVDLVASFLDALESSPYTQQNRFASFAPVREEALCKWYIDGESYYEDLYKNLLNAKESVYITDWWLSPELYLVRPVGPKLNQETRLDRVLEQLAQKNVKIYILIFREPKIALANDSEHTKYSLQQKLKHNGNIIILRHPNTVVPLLWSHHEKMVVIDQQVGFLGGLDLCYGRCDTQQHLLFDQPVQYKNETVVTYPGIDYSNVRIKDFVNVKDFNQDSINRNFQPKLPWHDVQIRIVGEPVKDMTRHFIQYWNFAKVNIYSKDNEIGGQILPQENQDKQPGKMANIMNKFKFKNLKNFFKKDEDSQSEQSTSSDRHRKDSNATNLTQESSINNTTQQPLNENVEIESQKPKIIIIDENNVRNKNNSKNNNDNHDQENSIIRNKSPSHQSHNTQNSTPNKSPKAQKQNISILKYIKDIQDEDQQLRNSFIPNNHNINQSQKKNNQNEKIVGVTQTQKITRNQISFRVENDDFNIEEYKDDSDSQENEQNPYLMTDTNMLTPNKNNASAIKKSSNIDQSQITQIAETEEEYQNSDEDSKNNSQLNKKKTIEKLEQNEVEQDQIINKNDKKQKITEIQKQDSNLDSDNSENLSQQEIQQRKLEKFLKMQGDSEIQRQLPGRTQSSEQELQSQNSLNAGLNRSMYARSVSYNSSISNDLNFPSISNRKRQKSLDDIKDLQQQQQDLVLPILQELAQDYQEDEKVNFFMKNKENQNSEKSENKRFKLPKFFKKKNEEEAVDEAEQHEEKDLLQHDDFKIQNPMQQELGTCSCQMLRSSSQWSLGLLPEHKEMSIQIAYIELITKAKHFIYIENQFFISCSAGNEVKNKIAKALIDRIKLAAERKEKFKVIVFMPLLPGFEGEINGSNAGVMKCQLHWELNTIARGGNSILEQLQKDKNIEDPSEYIQFFGLRTHEQINDIPVTEIIYIHSKLMIVDDNYVIIGSANINDRSLQGSRDSEICMIIEDKHKVKAKMAGNTVHVGDFSSSFRRNLYQEHFGISEEESIDPLDEDLILKLNKQTKKNTEIYREIFRCYPDDTCLSMSQFENFRKNNNLNKYNELKDEIKGFAVQQPLNFLKKEDLNLKITNKEYLIPYESFT